MNWKCLVWAALLVFAALIVTELIVHFGVLGRTYESLEETGIFRPQSEIRSYMWVGLITGAVFSFFFVFIFARGYENRGLMEGVRYAIYVTLLFNFVVAFSQYVHYGIPYSLAWYWIILGLVRNVIYGLIAAAVYKSPTASTR